MNVKRNEKMVRAIKEMDNSLKEITHFQAIDCLIALLLVNIDRASTDGDQELRVSGKVAEDIRGQCAARVRGKLMGESSEQIKIRLYRAKEAAWNGEGLAEVR